MDKIKNEELKALALIGGNDNGGIAPTSSSIEVVSATVAVSTFVTMAFTCFPRECQ